MPKTRFNKKRNISNVLLISINSYTMFSLSSGRLYNATGQRNNLWTQYSINNFISLQQCYIDEYSNLTWLGIALRLSSHYTHSAYTIMEYRPIILCLSGACMKQ